jgi:hypothetical protein
MMPLQFGEDAMNANNILKLTKAHVGTYLPDDQLPIIVAVADPKKIRMGISIQRNYLLTLIERNHGVPFARYRSNAVVLVSNPEELHGYKWSIETHDAVFEADETTDARFRDGRQRRVAVELSTGIGNVLQNLRSLAYVDRTAVGERADQPAPYACLVQYSGDFKEHPFGVGLELLVFNEDRGCQRVDKNLFLKQPVEAVRKAEAKFEENIRWAVSGYPLMIAGTPVDLETTARNVSDYRHIWRLPKLQKTLVQHLAKISGIPNANNVIEFYFGFDEIRQPGNFVLATRNEPIRCPIEVSMPRAWIETMCAVCEIPEDRLADFTQPDSGRGPRAFKFDPDELKEDFSDMGYQLKMDAGEVINPGDFFIDRDRDRNEILVRLLPAIYPHHIVGLSADGLVANISICGQSGRSGITIDKAKELCKESGMTNALIFDNGNDVFARLRGGFLISHARNTCQTRLTAALHFASLLDPGPIGGIDIVSDNYSVRNDSAHVP